MEKQYIPDYVDHSRDREDPITIDKLLTQMDDVYNIAAIRRDRIIQKLMDTVEKVNIDPNVDDVDDVTKKVLILDTANKIIAESEKSFTTRINTRLKQKEADANTVAGQMAVDLLRKISLATPIASSGTKPDFEEQTNKLSELCKDLDVGIPDTELKTDAKDVPMLDKELEEDIQVNN